MEIDWSKAPNGATHYNPSARTIFWYRQDGDIWRHFKGGRWVKSFDLPHVISSLIFLKEPIRNESLSVADEREKGIRRLERCLGGGNQHTRRLLEVLYDAGCRKVSL